MKKSIISAMVLVFIAFCLSFVPFKTKANITGGGINVGARLEVSKDNGATWYNYSADENSGNQTLTANPGDTLLFRSKVWNEGVNNPVNLILSGIISHLEYFDTDGSFYNPDEDVNGVEYDGTIGTNTITLSQILTTGGDANSGYEGGTFQATLKADIPDQTIITATFQVDQIAVITYQPQRINLIPKALAQFEGTAISTVRILVSNNLPQTGSSN